MKIESIGTASKFKLVNPRQLAKVNILFLLTVIAPTICAVFYFGLLASDVYVSESRYIVRTQGKQAPSGLASLLVGSELSGLTGNAGSAVADYAISRDAMNALNNKEKLRQVYTRPEISIFDRFNGLGLGNSNEAFYNYFSGRVSIEQNTQSSITTLIVRAYRPEDARWVNERLLELGEGLVNRLNQRSREDLVRFAETEVNEARESARKAAVALSAYRNSHEIIDPEKQAGVSLQMISKLQDEMILAKTQLTQMHAFTPDNPQIPVLRSRIASLEHEIDEEMLKVAGGKGSLAAKTTEYARLTLDTEYAAKALTNAMASLQNANNDARRQQAYIERIVQPNTPDKATQPRRLRSIFAVIVLGLVAWGVLSLLFSATREHNL
jgi:capsular polysaccharide transport system permease protein